MYLSWENNVQRIWPRHSHDQNQFDFYLYSILQNKHNINNPRTEGDVKESIPGVGGGVFLISPEKLWHAINNGLLRVTGVCMPKETITTLQISKNM